MSDRSLFQTSHVADQLGVSVSTVRRFCTRYALHLSAAAAPAPGGRRSFTEDDIAILRQALELTAAGMSEDDIARRLRQGVTLPAQPLTTPPEPLQQPPTLPTLRIDTTALVEPIQRLVESQDRQTEALRTFTTALYWFAAALVLITLIAVAVAAGWIG